MSLREFREVSWPKNNWINWFQQLKFLVRKSPLYFETHFSNSYRLMNCKSWAKTYFPEFMGLNFFKALNKGQIKSKNQRTIITCFYSMCYKYRSEEHTSELQSL